MTGQLFTIGHSVHDPQYFIELLKQHRVNYVLDVRSTPFSRFAEQYNRGMIDRMLSEHDIAYSSMGKYFGARQEAEELYTEEGYLDFERVRQWQRFQQGRDNVITGLERGNRIALMCTEKDPMDCHRAILVSRAFEQSGVPVEHILADGTLQSQDQLNERLLDRYFPDRNQVSLFDLMNEGGSDPDALLEEAYRMRNREIGYHLNRGEEGNAASSPYAADSAEDEA